MGGCTSSSSAEGNSSAPTSPVRPTMEVVPGDKNSKPVSSMDNKTQMRADGGPPLADLPLLAKKAADAGEALALRAKASEDECRTASAAAAAATTVAEAEKQAAIAANAADVASQAAAEANSLADRAKAAKDRADEAVKAKPDSADAVAVDAAWKRARQAAAAADASKLWASFEKDSAQGVISVVRANVEAKKDAPEVDQEPKAAAPPGADDTPLAELLQVALEAAEQSESFAAQAKASETETRRASAASGATTAVPEAEKEASAAAAAAAAADAAAASANACADRAKAVKDRADAFAKADPASVDFPAVEAAWKRARQGAASADASKLWANYEKDSAAAYVEQLRNPPPQPEEVSPVAVPAAAPGDVSVDAPAPAS